MAIPEIKNTSVPILNSSDCIAGILIDVFKKTAIVKKPTNVIQKVGIKILKKMVNDELISLMV